MRRLLLASALLAAACATNGAASPRSASRPERTEVAAGGARFVVEHVAPADDAVVSEVVDALPEAVARAARWGRLEAPVRIVIHAAPASFEDAIQGVGYPSIRAWARYDVVDLRSPRLWQPPGGRAGELLELLAHELTHCVLYQRGFAREAWTAHDVPFWFREGMAAAPAEGGERTTLLQRVAAGLGTARLVSGADPLATAEALAASRPALAHDTARAAFSLLVERYGPERVARVLDVLRAGQPFATAFATALGESVEEHGALLRASLLAARR